MKVVSLFELIFGNPWSDYDKFQTFNPEDFGFDARTNYKENKTEFILEIILTGFEKSEISIIIENNILKVGAKSGKKNESSYREYSNQFWLEDNVDLSKISSVFKMGILTVNIPKRPIDKDLRLTKPLKISIS